MLFFEGNGGGGGTATTTQSGNENSGDQSTQNQNANEGQSQSNDGSESAVAKAYEKLRLAEDQNKALTKENKELKQNLSEADQLKQENEQLRTQVSTLTTDLAKAAGESLARLKGFIDPEAAIATLIVRGTDISDRAKTEAALTDLAKEKQEMVGQTTGGSGGPINPNTQTTPSGNEGINQAIRRMAGRG